jgi:hypothetical protein
VRTVRTVSSQERRKAMNWVIKSAINGLIGGMITTSAVAQVIMVRQLVLTQSPEQEERIKAVERKYSYDAETLRIAREWERQEQLDNNLFDLLEELIALNPEKAEEIFKRRSVIFRYADGRTIGVKNEKERRY